VRQKFGSKERDIETGLDYFGARYFSSIQGRFTSPDVIFADQSPGNPQSWNLFSYVLNNPLRYVDPLGMAHVDANGNWVGDEDGEYDKQTGLYWHGSTQSWGDRQNSNAVNHIAGSSQEAPTNPGYAALGTAAVATQLDSPVPGPADLIAGGIAIYGLYKLATWSPPPAIDRTWVELIPGRTPLPPPPLVDPNIFTQGDRDARKINQKRLDGLQKQLEELKQALANATKKPNKTPEDKTLIEQIKRAINKVIDAMKKSETHGRTGKGN